jgi:hypothetical protein
MKDVEPDFQFGLTMSLIGRHPDCGCAMALSMDATAEAQQDFEKNGLLLEFLPASAALNIWGDSQWPCPHSHLRRTRSPQDKSAIS